MRTGQTEMEKRILLREYESTVHAMLENKKVLGLPDYMVEDLRKLREKTEEIRKMERLGI